MDKTTFMLNPIKSANGDIKLTEFEELSLSGGSVVSEKTVEYESPAAVTIDSFRILGYTLLQGKKQTDLYSLLEHRIGDLEERETKLSKRLAKLEEQNNMPGAVLSAQCEKLLGYLEYLRGLEDIREQLQYSTLALKHLDKMFAACSGETERFHRQLILKLRSAVKLNCDKDLFTEKQIDTLEDLVKGLQGPELKKDQVLMALDRLIDVDLSPFPSLEDEDETISGYNRSN